MEAAPISQDYSETLTRLSSKPGVKSALVIDQSLKIVLHSTGSFSWLRMDSPAPLAVSNNSIAPHALQDDGNQKEKGVQELGSMVWNYVNATETLIHSLDAEDTAKLLRLRTKKHELLILPDPKFIFVVVRDATSS